MVFLNLFYLIEVTGLEAERFRISEKSFPKLLVTVHDKVNDEYITIFFDVPVCISSYLDSGMYTIELVTALYFLIVEYLLASSGIRVTIASIFNTSHLHPLIQDMDYLVFGVATTARDIKHYILDFCLSR